MRRVVAGLIAVIASVTLLACGGSRTRPGTEGTRATIAVDNRAFTDMTVYVVESAGARRRLGLATGVSTTVFSIPASVVGNGRELQFIVDPIGSDRTATSNSLFVMPGERVTLVIPPA